MALGNLSKKKEKSFFDLYLSDIDINSVPNYVKTRFASTPYELQNFMLTQYYNYNIYDPDTKNIYFISPDDGDGSITITTYNTITNKVINKHHNLGVRVSDYYNTAKLYNGKIYMLLGNVSQETDDKYVNVYLYSYDTNAGTFGKEITFPITKFKGEILCNIIFMIEDGKFLSIIEDKIYKIDVINTSYEIIGKFNKYIKMYGDVRSLRYYNQFEMNDNIIVLFIIGNSANIPEIDSLRLTDMVVVSFDKSGNLLHQRLSKLINFDNNSNTMNLLFNKHNSIITLRSDYSDKIQYLLSSNLKEYKVILSNKVADADEFYHFHYNLVYIGNDEFLLFNHDYIYKLIPSE